MKIYLTEYQIDNKIYAGVNIFALDEYEAELIATENGVTIAVSYTHLTLPTTPYV